MTVRIHALVPGDKAVNPITIPGTNRKYSGSLGALTSVPEFDSIVLRAAGWVRVNGGSAHGDVGPTSGRPAEPALSPGFVYLDTTLNVVAVFAGKKSGWVNAATGASV